MFELLLPNAAEPFIPVPILQGIFTAKTPGVARYSHLIETIGDKAYAFGGTAAAVMNTLSTYNFATDTWADLTPLNPPTARYGMASCVIDGKLYIFGGYTNAAQVTSYVYDPVTNEWTAIANLPSARYYGQAVAINGKAYIYAGFNGSVPLNDCIEYDPVTNTYAGKAAGPGTRHAHSAVALDGEMHIIGGVRVSTVLREHVAYNPATNTWRTVSNALPFTRTYFSVCSTGRHIYTFGGSQNGTTSINNCYRYSAKDNWEEILTSPGVRYAHKMTAYDNKAWMYGGRVDTTPIAEMWMME